jgi:hypothetical protein
MLFVFLLEVGAASVLTETGGASVKVTRRDMMENL